MNRIRYRIYLDTFFDRLSTVIGNRSPLTTKHHAGPFPSRRPFAISSSSIQKIAGMKLAWHRCPVPTSTDSQLVLMMAGGWCGSSASDESARLQSLPKASVSHSLLVGDPTIHEKKIEGNVNGTVSVNQSGATPASISSIPLSVTNDRYSPEVRDRYRALDYWEAKDSKAPLQCSKH